MQSNSPFFAPKIVWFALVLSQFLYVFIAAQNGGEWDLSSVGIGPDFTDQTQGTLAIVAFGNFVLAWIIPEFVLKSIRPKLAANLSPQAVLRSAFAPLIMRLAILESVTLLGFVIAYLSHQPAKILPFMALSLTGFIKCFPTEDRMRSFLQPRVL